MRNTGGQDDRRVQFMLDVLLAVKYVYFRWSRWQQSTVYVGCPASSQIYHTLKKQKQKMQDSEKRRGVDLDLMPTSNTIF